MAGYGAYFVKEPKNLIPKSRYIIKGKYYRFSVLTPRLIRIEYNKNGQFEDRATSLVVNRSFEEFMFTYGGEDPALIITTDYFTLTYVKENPITQANMKVVLNGTDREWYPGHKEVRNVGSIAYSLDNLDKEITQEKANMITSKITDDGIYNGMKNLGLIG